jgi:hypothetical protein
LAQEKIYQILTSNIPFQNIKLIQEDYTYEDRQQKLSGLFLTRDADYRTLMADIEDSVSAKQNQYADQEVPTQEQLAEEIAVNYFYLVFKALLGDLSDCYGFDPSYFSSENLTD